jgi:uncharacterized protein (DUF362 family)
MSRKTALHNSVGCAQPRARPPNLTLMRCYRGLLHNGPTGGNLVNVALNKTIVAGNDSLAIDAYVAKAC